MSVEAEIQKMKAYIEGFPGHVAMALEIGNEATKNFRTSDVNAVLIAGLGGSGIGGKIISQLVWDTCKVPILLINDYQIPAWVNEKTLFIGCSYSGNTEETLAAVDAAHGKGAQISCISSGGTLSEKAANNGFNIIKIPAGQPPRTSFGFNATQLFFVLNAYGLIGDDFKQDLADISNMLADGKNEIQSEARNIAEKINNTIPVIYSDARVEGVAIRFRQQINENAKMLCWHHVLPEMNHNELVGWAGGSNQMSALFIATPDDHPNTKKRMELTRDIIAKKTETLVDIAPKGNNRNIRAYYLIHLCDWVSYYLAELNQVDPIEIEVIDYLKSELAKS